MAFDNLVVQRLITHEVFRRRDDGNLVTPRYGDQPINLAASAMDAFRERVVDALGGASQSMEMEIAKSDPGSALEAAAAILGRTPAQFSSQSKKFADMLAAAQIGKNLPGGILVVFSGTVGAAQRPLVGLIKAETQTGFRRRISGGQTDVQFLHDLFLTPAAKLYKIGVFVQEKAGKTLPGGWKAFVYDSLMTGGNKAGAAKYFYEGFLGCQLPVNSASLTKAFFENTRDFIKKLDITTDDRADLLTSLYTYLKVDTAPTIEVSGFANSFLPNVETRDAYRNFMLQQKFPETAVPKDLAELGPALKFRRLAFGPNIRLTAPPEAFGSTITIERLPQDGVGPGSPSAWTRITIRDEMREA